MKILLTGVTGFIGGEVLKQCLEHPFIDSILVLSRRSLNSGIKTDKELEVLIIEDFLNYGESVVEKFRDVDCCIWSLGQKGTNHKVEVEYPLALLNALASVIITKRFRYMHVSGILAEANQSKSLWFMEEGRHIKGLAETVTLRFTKDKSKWESYVVKPSVVLPSHARKIHEWFNLPLGSVKVDALAACCIEIVLKGNEGGEGDGEKFGVEKQRVLQNAHIVRKGNDILSSRGS